MRELSLNILDIAQNSIKAQATLIEIEITLQSKELKITIKDNGSGMSEEFLAKVTDPFTTTRTTRKVGMGIPLFKEGAEASGGKFTITSKLGEGTKVSATYDIDNIDRMPLGSIEETIATLIHANPNIDYLFNYTVNGEAFRFCTKEVKEIMQEVAIDSYEVLDFIKEHIKENVKIINGGLII